MSAAEALKRAHAAGVHVGTDGRDLLLEAAAAPPPAVLDELARHKADIVALLRPKQDELIAEHRPHPSQTRTAPTRRPSTADYKTQCGGLDQGAVVDLLKAAKAAGVTFFEHVANGDLVIEEPPDLAPDLRNTLHVRWDEIRAELLPEVLSTASRDLLTQLGIQLVFVDTEERAAEEGERICASANMLGLDLETAPRPEFLPALRPIAVTASGHCSKNQEPIDTSAGLDPFRAEVRLLQVAAEINGRMTALVVDLRRVPLQSPALAPLWGCRLVGHNLSFDAKMLVANGVEVPDDNLLDTILTAGLVLRGAADKGRDGSRRPSLTNAVDEALGIELPKEAQLSPWWRDRLTNEQIAYAALDAGLALRLAGAILPRIARLPRGPDGKALLDRLCAAVMPVARMELAGVMLDRDALAKQIDAWNKELARLKTEIAKLGIENPSSGPQIAVWLRRELQRLGGDRLSNWPRTPGGELSTTAKHLGRLEGVLPEVKLLVQFSSFEQLQSNFGTKLLERISPQTGRLHGNFLLAKAKSGRFSSANPNLQNIPKTEAMRSVFVAAPGKKFVVADYSQLELQVMAAIAQDTIMTNAYRAGLDLHAVTAAGMLGIKPDAFDPANPTHKEARQKAKAVNFGVIFGSGPHGLQEFARDAYDVQITVEEARAVIDRFLATYPGVARWQRRQESQSRETRSVSTIGGRVYRFAWEPNGAYVRNLALNLPIQGTAAEIAIEAMIRIDARLRKDLPGKAQLVLQVHDEFVVEVEDDESAVSVVKCILEQEMTAAFEALLPGAPTTGLVKAHTGPTWATAKR